LELRGIRREKGEELGRGVRMEAASLSLIGPESRLTSSSRHLTPHSSLLTPDSSPLNNPLILVRELQIVCPTGYDDLHGRFRRKSIACARC